MAAPLSEEIALRIGLAARVLEQRDPRLLLRALIDIMGEPITAVKLTRLRAQRLRSAATGALADVDADLIQRAVTLLKGQGVERVADKISEPLPTPQPIDDGELPASVRIACASNIGERIDGHFGSCERFLIYQVAAGRALLIDIREPGTPPADVDRNAWRAEQISDCHVLYTISIGGPAAAKAVRAGLHPIKLSASAPAREEIARLQAVLAQASPPPWLQKAMGTLASRRDRYVEQAS